MTEEEKKAIEYYSNKEVSFEVNFDKKKLLKDLGITEEDSFENQQIRIKTLLNLINKLQKENKEKDKQIDLMAEYISNLDIDENICKEQSDNNCDDINREADCKDCIKQYFEKLSKEKKIKYEQEKR